MVPRSFGLEIGAHEQVAPLKVVIAGRGLGGLTAALALAQRGFDVEVYEPAGEVREVGAGVRVGPSAPCASFMPWA
jgi:ribulose 1,5-bisphosphate synthetase/thiazole synthase